MFFSYEICNTNRKKAVCRTFETLNLYDQIVVFLDYIIFLAKMMELVDMLGLGSGVLYNELKGSTPFFGNNNAYFKSIV